MNVPIPKEKILFLDIETVPLQPSYHHLSPVEKELFELKTAYTRKEITPELFYNKAGIWAEFGKIICISVGYFSQEKFRIKSFNHTNEKELLQQFAHLLNNYFNTTTNFLCGHNAKEFDFPFIARRMIIQGVLLPKQLNLFGKKPWEINHLDTMELWKFGDYKHYTSLKLLTHLLGIPSPKNDIDGSMVAEVYYKENDLERITKYCEQDVLALARIFLRMNNEHVIAEDEVIIA